jgi:hypothetical protein
MVLDAGTFTSGNGTEYGACPLPILEAIPILGSLFRVEYSKREPSQELVLVTARIIAPQEEEEPRPPTTRGTAKAPDACPACKACDARVKGLLAKYHEACAAGRLTEARRWAMDALAIDPACFSTPAADASKKCPGSEVLWP